MNAKTPDSILFVCLGNICRSPLAEGLFRQSISRRGLAARFRIDSAGTGGWHAGEAPDPRAIAVAARHGVDISAQRARAISAEDFADFALILAMDRRNLAEIGRRAPAGSRAATGLFMDFALGDQADVPDPYTGDAAAFLDVYRMIQVAAEALADRLVPPE